MIPRTTTVTRFMARPPVGVVRDDVGVDSIRAAVGACHGLRRAGGARLGVALGAQPEPVTWEALYAASPEYALSPVAEVR